MSGVRLVGLSTLLGNLNDLKRKYPEAARIALDEKAQDILADARDNLTPLKYGQLRASGHVVTWPDRIRSEVGFGGPAGIGTNTEDVNYAVIQHERLDFKHPIAGEAKYLEKAALRAVPTVPSDVAEIIKRLI